MSKTLLVNWVYYKPVGHALEAIQTARGFYEADNDLKISILLNSETPCELGEVCSWIEKVYPIDVIQVNELGLKADCIKNIPKEWDYIVTDERYVNNPGSYAESLKYVNDLIVDYFQARIWKGCRLQPPFENAPEYKVDNVVRFQIPFNAKKDVEKYANTGLKICFLPAGASPVNIYPNAQWWSDMISAVTKRFPDVKFYMTGAKSRAGNRSASYTFTEADISMILSKNDNVENCFDIGFINQLALLEFCDILIAPHSGFAFLASCVNTPWLSLSGASWPEYFYNRTKFYNVLPQCTDYPCYTGMKEECESNINAGKMIECMNNENLSIQDVIKGIELLTDPDFSFKKSVNLYVENLTKNAYDLNKFWSLHGILNITKGIE